MRLRLACLLACLLAGLSPAFADNAYSTFIMNSMTAVPLEADVAKLAAMPAAQLAMARRGSDSFQIALAPKQDLTAVRVETADLVAGKNRIAAANVEWFVVGYTPAGKSRMPDMLLPGRPFAAGKDRVWTLYITVHAPAATPTASYTGSLRVLAEGQPPTSIPITATVFDFTLPSGPGHCRTAFALQEGFKTKWAEGEYLKYADFMLDHRLNPDDIYRLKPPRIADLEHFYERGMNYFTASKVSKGWDLGPLRTFFDELAKSPHGAQLRKQAAWYGYDEKGKDQWPGMGECFRTLHAAFPDIKTMTTAHVYMDWPDPVARMKEYDIDIVAPWEHPGYPIYYRFAEGEKVRAAGRELWAYNINFQTHYPLIQSRLTWWQMYQQKADGWMYYCVNGWDKDAKPVDPANGPLVDFTTSSSYSQAELMYPGIDGPIGSLRLANIRDGIEDYEYLYALAQKTGDVEVARELAEPVSWGILQWTDKPEVVSTARARVAGWIVRPYLARTPVPGHRATGVNRGGALTWSPDRPKDVTAFDVYLGTDRAAVERATPNTPEYRGHITKPLMNAGPLQAQTTYYWRVDEVTKRGLYPGYVWSFTTVGDTPVSAP